MRHRAPRWRHTSRAPLPEQGNSARLAFGVLLAVAVFLSGCVRCHSPLQPALPQPVAQKSGVHNPEDIELIDREKLLLVSNGASGDCTGGGAITALKLPFDENEPALPFIRDTGEQQDVAP